jgi:flagellar biosynthesis protein FlhF
MKAKTYKARTIQQALDQIKSELGSGAMILSTRKLEGHNAFGLLRRNTWEVTAAAGDFTTRRESDARNPLLKASDAQEHRAPAPRPGRGERPQLSTAAAPALVAPLLQSSDTRFETLLAEVNGLKRTLQFITRTLPAAPQDGSGVYAGLLAQGFEPETAEELAAAASTGNPPAAELRDRVRRALAGMLLVETPVELVARARTISVFVGPSGAGKTTTIAKIAGHARARYRKRVTLVSLDTFRIGGQDQLAAFGHLMDIPAYSCPDVPNLNRLIRSLDDDLILVDTAGVNPNDQGRLEAVKAVARIPDARVHAVLGAATRPSEIDRFTAAFETGTPMRIVITKTDEVEEAGPCLVHALKKELAISYLTAGPNVPEDLQVPTAEELAARMLPVEALGGVTVAT